MVPVFSDVLPSQDYLDFEPLPTYEEVEVRTLLPDEKKKLEA